MTLPKSVKVRLTHCRAMMGVRDLSGVALVAHSRQCDPYTKSLSDTPYGALRAS